MKKRIWKSMAAWILIAVLCAGNIQVSASDIQETETSETEEADVTDPTGETDTNDATNPVDEANTNEATDPSDTADSTDTNESVDPADATDTTEDSTLLTSSEETYEAAAPKRKMRAPAANQDVVMPSSATLVYGQKFYEAELVGAKGDGDFLLYDAYTHSDVTTNEAALKASSELDNIAEQRIDDVTGQYRVWFVPADGSGGWGQPITIKFLPKPIMVVINDINITYGEKASYTHGDIEWAFGEDATDYHKPIITLTAKDADGNPVTEKTPAGTYTITGAAESDYYDVKFQTGQLTIEPKEAALSWSGYNTRIYDPNLSSHVTASVSNLINGDTCSVMVENGTNKNAGEYTAVAVGLNNPNYKLPEAEDSRSQEYTIEKATPACENVTASLTYGQTLAEAKTQGTATNPTNGKTVPGSFVFDSGDTLPVVADSGTTKYSMTFHPEDTTNYHEVPITQYQLTVSKKPLTVQMMNMEKIYGDELSADAFVSYDPAKLVGNDTLNITPTATGASGTTEPLDPTYIDAGTYTISADPDTLNTENPNYAITVLEGTLTVQPRPVILKWSDVSNIVYQHVDGTENPTEWEKVGANVTASIENLVKQADGTLDDCQVVVTGGNAKNPSRGGRQDFGIHHLLRGCNRFERSRQQELRPSGRTAGGILGYYRGLSEQPS